MLEDAENDQWQQVIDTEAKRQKLIKDFFNKNQASQHGQEIAAGIEEILAIDRKLMNLGKDNMQMISAKLKKNRTGNRAVNIYSRNCVGM